MKRLILCWLLAVNLTDLVAQEPLSYQDMLAKTPEIELGDSLDFRTGPFFNTPIDTFTVKKWFTQVLFPYSVGRFRTRVYHLEGKITANSGFDLFVLSEEKWKNDSAVSRIVYLVSMKKSGEYIASIKTASEGTKKKSNLNISSCLYPDFTIVRDSRIQVDSGSLNDLVSYRINPGGRFVSYQRSN